MPETLANIQELARNYADDSNLAITSGKGLKVANQIYQGMFTENYKILGNKIGRRWPEATRLNTTISTVVDVEEYDWITSPVFKPGFYVEYFENSYTTVDVSSTSGQKVVKVASTLPFKVNGNVLIAEGTSAEETGVVASISAGVSVTLDDNLSSTHASGVAVVSTSNNDPIPIYQATNMTEWSRLGYNTSGLPQLFSFVDRAGIKKFALRPVPDTTGDIIRITGLIELGEFTGETTTVDVSSAAGQAVVSVAKTTMFHAGGKVIIAEGTSAEETGIVLSISAGVSITLTGNLANTHAALIVVSPMSVFADKSADRAFAHFVAADFNAKWGDTGRALEILGDGKGLLPEFDYTPRLRPTVPLRPWKM